MNCTEGIYTQDAPKISIKPADGEIEFQGQRAKVRCIDLGVASGLTAFNYDFGGFILRNGAAFYAYSQYTFDSAFEQYLYANLAHELAMRILNYSILGISASSIATATTTILVGVTITKLSVFVYNRWVDDENQITLSLVEATHIIFCRVFLGGIFSTV